MIGRRVPPNAEGWITGVLSPGDYFKAINPSVAGRPAGEWHAKTPNGHMCNLSAHHVDEHEDGTITVSPSIKVSDAKSALWHGYLRKGVWSEC